MSTDTRFDEEILKQAQTSIDTLLKHKEVRSVAVVIDWDLPNKQGLPTGAWQPARKEDVLGASLMMTAQLNRMAVNQSRVNMQVLNDLMTAAAAVDTAKAPQQDLIVNPEQKDAANVSDDK